MKNSIYICLGFFACFALGFVCGMHAQTKIIAGTDFWTAGSTCLDGSRPDIHGCCAGEEYTNMGDLGYNCCPVSGGDCFPPIK